jgi:predicted kinase
MNPIFLIVGPPAAGKSTTARALLARFPKGIHIPVDDLRHMVVAGLHEPGDWTDALLEQLRLARQTAAGMARTYQAAGFAVVIDDFFDPVTRLSEYATLLSDPTVRRVVLLPDQAAAEERLRRRARSDDPGEFMLRGVRHSYVFLNSVAADLAGQGWQVIDTSHLTVEETVAVLTG